MPISQKCKSYRKITGWGNTLDPLTIRCNAEICSRPEGQGWSARTRSVPKNPKIEVLGINGPLSEEFCNSVPKGFMMTLNLCFVLKFHGNRPLGSRWNDVLFWWQKVVHAFFQPLGKGAESLQRSMAPCQRLHVKFHPNRFLFAGVISEKVIIYDRNICLWHIIKQTTG